MKYFLIILGIITLSACQAKEFENNKTSNDELEIKQSPRPLGESENNPAIQKKSTNQPTTFTKQNLRQKYGAAYYYYDFDVNADGLNDLVITPDPRHEQYDFMDSPYTLYVYIATSKRDYQLSLTTTNFASDGGNRLLGVLPRTNQLGFIISTYFPDRGSSYQDYYIKPNDNKWVIEKMVYKGQMMYDGNTVSYYCTFLQDDMNMDGDVTLNSIRWSNEEMLEYCPDPASDYRVISKKAEILDKNFQSQNPSNYFIAGDTVQAVEQNDEWVRVMYKNETKTGWLDKRQLSAIAGGK